MLHCIQLITVFILWPTATDLSILTVSQYAKQFLHFKK